jgi:hypothetical protein
MASHGLLAVMLSGELNSGTLRARRQRPRGCRAAEQRDELAPPNVEHRLSLRSRSASSACHRNSSIITAI